jgi:hypothetical protein
VISRDTFCSHKDVKQMPFLSLQPQSFSVPEGRLLIVLVSGFGRAVCLLSGGGRAAVPGVPGCAPCRAVPPSVSLGCWC